MAETEQNENAQPGVVDEVVSSQAQGGEAQAPALPKGFGKPMKTLKDFKDFKFQQAPYYKKHLSMFATKALADLALSDRVVDAETLNRVRMDGIAYLGSKILGTSLDKENITKNAMMQTMYEFCTGITEEYLSENFRDGEDYSAEAVEELTQTANKSFEKWSGSVFAGKLKGVIGNATSRKTLEDEIKELNKEFKLGFKEKDMADSEKLVSMAFQGYGKEKSYEMQQEGAKPYRPSAPKPYNSN